MPLSPNDTAHAHSRAVEELLESLRVDSALGLPEERVEEMRARYGANRLPEPKTRSNFLRFLDQFNNPLIFILLGAAVLTTVVADASEAITILFVVIFNAVIGYVQEQRAGARLKAVKALTAPSARVVRSGVPATVETGDLVVGDIVLLESGMRVPADLRLLLTTDLSVDESTLTGESLPVVKNPNARLIPETTLGDRITMVYAGTTVRRGRGRGVVTGVGEHSEIGRISRGIADAEESSSPLQERLARFGTVMAVGIAVVLVVIFGVGLLRGYDALTMLTTSIGLAVSAIPEGLPIAVTVALSIGVYRMARQHAIVRKMNAVETLGSTSVICSDKTGTLTRNAMTTVMVATDDRIVTVTGTGYEPRGTLLDDAEFPVTPQDNTPLDWTLRIGLLCTESSFRAGETGARELVGDPTEGAMIVAAEKAGMAEREWKRWQTEVTLPFESERMYMVSTIESREGERALLVKGSLERVLAMCNREHRTEGIVPLNQNWIEERTAQFAARGLRTIALAYRPLGSGERPDPAHLESMIFSGIQGIEDPPREEARQAISDALQAGIKVVMITGDHAATAASIARQLHLAGDREVRTVTGAELENMDEGTFEERVERIDVYARVAPEHKLRIVRQLQRRGHVVAMTGDGVNDAPALKQADIGVAMGSGTDLAREASAMVVQDDNFATIVQAVRYGRVMFRNLQHMVLYVLTTSAGGVLTLMTTVVLGFQLPMTAVQLLWINLVTDGTSTIPLAYEPEHGNSMRQPPRSRREGLLNWQMGERILGSGLIMMLGTLFIFETALDRHGYSILSHSIPESELTYARTAAFTALALFQIWNVHNSRAFHHSIFQIGVFANRPLVAVTLLALALQVAAVELPFMHPLLKTTGLEMRDWWLCIGTSLALVVLVELRKLAWRAFDRRRDDAGPVV